MTITIDYLRKCIQESRQQEQKHIADAHACAGAVQAYEAMISMMLKSQRAAISQALNGHQRGIPTILDAAEAIINPPPGFPPVPGTQESVDLGYESSKAE